MRNKLVGQHQQDEVAESSVVCPPTSLKNNYKLIHMNFYVMYQCIKFDKKINVYHLQLCALIPSRWPQYPQEILVGP